MQVCYRPEADRGAVGRVDEQPVFAADDDDCHFYLDWPSTHAKERAYTLGSPLFQQQVAKPLKRRVTPGRSERPKKVVDNDTGDLFRGAED